MKHAAIAIVFLLAGCAPKYVMIATDDLCRSWRHQTVSKSDQISQQTAAIALGNNKSRPNWGCQYGKNQEKKP